MGEKWPQTVQRACSEKFVSFYELPARSGLGNVSPCTRPEKQRGTLHLFWRKTCEAREVCITGKAPQRPAWPM